MRRRKGTVAAANIHEGRRRARIKRTPAYTTRVAMLRLGHAIEGAARGLARVGDYAADIAVRAYHIYREARGNDGL